MNGLASLPNRLGIVVLSPMRPAPQFNRKPMIRSSLQLQIDDFYCAGRRSDVESFLPMSRTKLKLKDSDVVIEGGFEYLKRNWVKTNEGIFLQPHEKHSANIIA